MIFRILIQIGKCIKIFSTNNMRISDETRTWDDELNTFKNQGFYNKKRWPGKSKLEIWSNSILW